MLMKYGCGCIILVTKAIACSPTSTVPTHGRLVDYCGNSGNDDAPYISGEIEISKHIMAHNMPGKPLDAEAEAKIFEGLQRLILLGRRYEILAAQFKLMTIPI